MAEIINVVKAIFCTFGIAMALRIARRNEQWQHRREVDARIIAQAKEWGLWDKPRLLGGRALELKAWEAYKIKRAPGETDAHLRSRYVKIEIIKQKAEVYGFKIKKVKIDGHNIQITLCDETPPREGGHSNEQS